MSPHAQGRCPVRGVGWCAHAPPSRHLFPGSPVPATGAGPRPAPPTPNTCSPVTGVTRHQAPAPAARHQSSRHQDPRPHPPPRAGEGIYILSEPHFLPIFNTGQGYRRFLSTRVLSLSRCRPGGSVLLSVWPPAVPSPTRPKNRGPARTVRGTLRCFRSPGSGRVGRKTSPLAASIKGARTPVVRCSGTGASPLGLATVLVLEPSAGPKGPASGYRSTGFLRSSFYAIAVG